MPSRPLGFKRKPQSMISLSASLVYHGKRPDATYYQLIDPLFSCVPDQRLQAVN
jgi:hypothetical protein